MSWKFLNEIMEKDPDFTHKYVDFEPGIGKVHIFSQYTGYDDIMIAESEKSLGWHPFLADGKVYLAPHELPKFRLILKGEKGFDGINKIAADLAVIYTSDDFQGIALTKHIFDQMPKHLKEGKNFILADQYICQEQNTTVRGIWLVSEEGMPQGKALYIEHGKFDYQMDIETQMMPIIQLSEATMVEMERSDYDGSSKKKALHIRVACDLEVQRASILKMVSESEALNSKIKLVLSQMNF